jgi:hypothetical protein
VASAFRRKELEQLNVRDAQLWHDCARAGDLEAAWALSDRIRGRGRGRNRAVPRHQQQIWDGEPLDGRRVLVRCYHGLGDTLQFIRYAAVVRKLAREVIVWAQPALLPVLCSVDGIDRLVALDDGTPRADYDVDVEVMELPYVFRSTLATIPATVPYISVEPASLRPDSRRRVGLVWRAGEWDRRRSLPFALLKPLLDLKSISWFRLQYGGRGDERHPNLRSLDVTGIAATARWIRTLDLVITIDSMPAHLAGALGVPVWTLLPAEADWRWLERRPDSPWYPTMRLFRQPSEGDWSAVIDEVRSALG